MRKTLIAVTLAGLLLTGCSFIQAVVNPSPNIVSSLEATLAAANNAAVAYLTLPRCGSQAAVGALACSDADVAKKLVNYSGAATIAIEAAKANETADLVTAAQNAVSAYQGIINTIK